MERFADNPSAEPDATTVLKSGSASKLNLLNRAKRQLEKVEAAAEPDLKKAWPEYERLRRYVRQFKQAGFSPWPVIALAGCFVVGIVLLAAKNTRNTRFYTYPDNFLRVVENLDPCLPDGTCGHRFVIQAVVNGIPNPEVDVTICPKGIQPRFEAGHTFQWIRFTTLGSCAEIDGYQVLLDSHHQAIPAPNCTPDFSVAPTGHFNCAGGRAKF